MTVITWGDFLDVMVNIKPALQAPGKRILNSVVAWVLTLNWQMQGVRATAINGVKIWLTTLLPRFTGESKADLKRCIKFLGWVNGTIPSYEIDTQRVCEINKYYWWANSCNSYPKPPDEEAPPYVPTPTDPGSLLSNEVDFYNYIMWEYGEQTVIDLIGKASSRQSYYLNVYGNDMIVARDAALLEVLLYRVHDWVTRDLGQWMTAVKNIIGDATKLEGKTIIDSLGGTTAEPDEKTAGLISSILGFLDLSYNTSSLVVNPQAGGLSDNLLKIIDQWEAADRQLGGMTSQQIVDALKDSYDLWPETISDIKNAWIEWNKKWVYYGRNIG